MAKLVKIIDLLNDYESIVSLYKLENLLPKDTHKTIHKLIKKEIEFAIFDDEYTIDKPFIYSIHQNGLCSTYITFIDNNEVFELLKESYEKTEKAIEKFKAQSVELMYQMSTLEPTINFLETEN